MNALVCKGEKVEIKLRTPVQIKCKGILQYYSVATTMK